MPFRIKLSGTPYEFSADPDENIFEAAERNGYALSCACRSGACGACKAQIISGDVDLGKYQPFALTEADIKSGLALMCTAKARSDLEIKVRSVKVLETAKPAFIQVEAVEKTLLRDSILRLVLKRTDGGLFDFKVGQSYAVELPGGLSRSYSVASSELQKETIEFLIRRVTNGVFTSLLFSDGFRVGDQMKLKGPDGEAVFNTPKGRKAIFLATGTGIAPIKSMIQTLIEKDDLKDRSLHIYWGVRTSDDLFVDELFKDWAAHYPEIHYTPIVSGEESWKGVTGHVQTQAAIDHGDMSEVDVYMCGNGRFIRSAFDYLTVRCGLKDDHVFCDSFGD